MLNFEIEFIETEENHGGQKHRLYSGFIRDKFLGPAEVNGRTIQVHYYLVERADGATTHIRPNKVSRIVSKPKELNAN